FHLPRLVGFGRALELLLLGERIDAKRALELGLTSRVLPPGEHLEAALTLAARLAEGPPLALAAIKRATRASIDGTLADALTREAEGQAQLLASADLREGVAAWMAKRKPSFSGR
ncbi:MAG TPA: enoyl-CoA hydratase-related protein, partial [Polyangiaceae bacterium]|nr:enoyl-CoA hydratase-related protein [Polyangiaceae bacterium]